MSLRDVTRAIDVGCAVCGAIPSHECNLAVMPHAARGRYHLLRVFFARKTTRRRTLAMIAGAMVVVSCTASHDATIVPDAADARVVDADAVVADAATDLRPRLLVLLHSYGTNPAALSTYWDETYWKSQADLLVPYGSKSSTGVWTFNASLSCCQDTMTADDEGLIVAAIEALGPHRVYVAGFSNGGFMAQKLACDRPDLFAAAVNLSGAGRSDHDTPCGTTMAPTLLIHGTADPTVHYYTRGQFGTMPDQFISTPETLNQYHCGVDAFVVTGETHDYDDAVAGAETDVMRAPGCTSEHWRMNGSTHGPTFNQAWYRDVWAWLESRPL